MTYEAKHMRSIKNKENEALNNVAHENQFLRFDIYAFIHKALRAYLCQTLVRVGQMDNSDHEDFTSTLTQVLDLMTKCREHVANENNAIHHAMELRDPSSSSQTAREHVTHLQHIANIEQLVAETSSPSGINREKNVLKLYRTLALFVADNFEHMNVEENGNTQSLWRHYTDQELIGIQNAIIASATPEQNRDTMRWIIPHLNHQERMKLIQGLRRQAPLAVVQEFIDIASPYMRERDRSKMLTAL